MAKKKKNLCLKENVRLSFMIGNGPRRRSYGEARKTIMDYDNVCKKNG